MKDFDCEFEKNNIIQKVNQQNFIYKFKFNIDRGGTFTDIYCEYQKYFLNNENYRFEIPDNQVFIKVDKLLSSDPDNYEDAPAEGIRRIINTISNLNIQKGDKIPSELIESIRMGTTIATNALLERKGEKCALIITKGFRDAIEIGNQTRPNIFDLKIEKPEKIYDLVFEVDERVRIFHDFEIEEEKKTKNIKTPVLSYNDNFLFEKDEIIIGKTQEYFKILQKIKVEEIKEILRKIKSENINSISVAFVHSYSFPNHEYFVKKLASSNEFNIVNISLSCEIMPLVKFYPRASTAVVDAYLTPSISKYVSRFISFFKEESEENKNDYNKNTDNLKFDELNRKSDLNIFEKKRLKVLFMQSDGGLTNHNNFIGSKAIISGPAAGVVGYSLTTSSEVENLPIIGLDMGGTSTDVSRYDNGWEHVFEILINGIAINAPQIDVNTVAAGGGSRLFYKNGMYVVGPESAGAHPGPICYRKNGYLAITDANLILGRIIPKYFPSIFGKNAEEILDYQSSYDEMEKLTKKINKENHKEISVQEVALGFFKVANEAMCRPIKSLTQSRGFNPKDHILAIFGGAGGQHACSIAKLLGIRKVYIHKYAGILSAYGLSLAHIVEEMQEPVNKFLDDYILSENNYNQLNSKFLELENKVKRKLIKFENNIQVETYVDKNNNITFLNNEEKDKFSENDFNIISEKYLLLKYEGNDYNLVIKENKNSNYTNDFEKAFKREYGFLLEKRRIIIDNIRVRVSLIPKNSTNSDNLKENSSVKISLINKPIDYNFNYFDINGKLEKVKTDIYKLEDLIFNNNYDLNLIHGPAIILSGNSTILIEPDCVGELTKSGSLLINIPDLESVISILDRKTNEEIILDKFDKIIKNDNINDLDLGSIKTQKDSLELSLFANRFMAIAEQMGRHLQRTAVSTNIKERLDFSCALFDKEGNLVANAPHLPVHLGAMQEVVKHQINHLKGNWKENEVILCNHPMAGGSHLPDMTVITPVFYNEKVIFYLANRGHHSDIGGLTPGSMPPFSKNLDEEGAAFYSFKIIDNGVFQEDGLKKFFVDDLISKNLRPTANLDDNISDIKAQVAANNRGVELLFELIKIHTLKKVQDYMQFIQDSAEISVSEMLDNFAEQKCKISKDQIGSVYSEDFMDDGSKIALKITFNRRTKKCEFNFNGTSSQVYGNINTPKSIVYSSIIYCLRCLTNTEMPLNQGCLKPVSVIIPNSSLLNPDSECAVVGGNVTTSQRITDIILKAFGACAASQGCMNNFTFGCKKFGYYETIGGGSGAGPNWNGKSGIQVHMTNTRITDIEIIERRYPVIVSEFSFRKNSGGKGKFKGGDGIIRTFIFLTELEVSILSERRVFEPFGIEGGKNGQKGFNFLIKNNGKVFNIGSKNTVRVENGDSVTILTPGGGGYGKLEESKDENTKINEAKNENFEKSKEFEKSDYNNSYLCLGSLSQFVYNQYTN